MKRANVIRNRGALFWNRCLSFLGLIFLIAYPVHAAESSDGIKAYPSFFETKCEIKKERNDNAFIIWDSQSQLLLPCSSSPRKLGELQEALADLKEDNSAFDAFFDFQTDGTTENHNLSIPRSVIKVKKGQNLAKLASRYYGSPDALGKLFGKPVDPNDTKAKSKGYVFIPLPENRIKKRCTLGIFGNGYKQKPLTEGSLKKSCIFKESPVNFTLVAAEKIHYPEVSITNAPPVIEGGDLKFNVVIQGKQSLPGLLTYQLVHGKTSAIISSAKTLDIRCSEFECDQETRTIEIETVDDDEFEIDERVLLKVESGINVELGNKQAIGRVENNDPKAIVSVSSDDVFEGDTLQFEVRRKTGISNEPFSVSYRIEPASAGYKGVKNTFGTLKFESTDQTKYISVETIADKINEGVEEVNLLLDAEADVEIPNLPVTGIIKNVGPIVVAPQSGPVLVTGNKVVSGGVLDFIIKRAEPFDLPITLDYETVDQTAEAGFDYISTSGQITFEKGESQSTVRVPTAETNRTENVSFRLDVTSEDKVEFDSNSAIGDIQPGPLRLNCESDLEQLNGSKVNNENVQFIKRIGKYDRILESIGKVQRCDYVYISVNGTLLEDIETGKPVFTKADETGAYSLRFSAAATEDSPENTKAENELNDWTMKYGSAELIVGRHYRVDTTQVPETFEIFSSKLSPTQISLADFGERVGEYIFAIIPSNDDCRFEYRYEPRKIEKRPLYQYSLSGVDIGGDCHIRARGKSTIPNEEHVLFASKDKNFSDTSFFPSASGDFDISVSFPDTANFYGARVYLSKDDYTGETKTEREPSSDETLNSQSRSENVVPINSKGEELSGGQPANLESSREEQISITMGEFFEPLLEEMAEKYENCDPEKEEPRSQNPCSLKMIASGNELKVDHAFKLEGVEDALKDPDNANVEVVVKNKLKIWKYALVIDPEYGLIATGDLFPLQGVEGLEVGVQLVRQKSDFNSSEIFKATIAHSDPTFNTAEYLTGANKKTLRVPIKVKAIKPFDWNAFGQILLVISGLIGALYAFYKWIMSKFFPRPNYEEAILEIVRSHLNENKINWKVKTKSKKVLGKHFGPFDGSEYGLALQAHIPNKDTEDPFVFISKIVRATRQTCLLTGPNGKFGSGFLFKDDMILTNYHVYQEALNKGVDLDQITAVFDYATKANGRGVRSGKDIAIDTDFEPVWSPNSPGTMFSDNPNDLDFILLKLKQKVGQDPLFQFDGTKESRGFLAGSSTETVLSRPENVFVFHHPSGGPVKCSPGEFTSYEDENNRSRVRYNASTLRGSSGGAVLNSDFELVALHHAGDGENPPQFNQGIPIHLIKADIERQLAERGA